MILNQLDNRYFSTVLAYLMKKLLRLEIFEAFHKRQIRISDIKLPQLLGKPIHGTSGRQ